MLFLKTKRTMAVTKSSYETVTNEIINKAINSVMFIDDELLEPFSDPNEGSQELSKTLYNNFKVNNTSLDFYKFRDFEHWQERSEYTLNYRDLLIIDWQLSKVSPEHFYALSIIAEAVKKQNLHFVCIYTSTEQKDFPDIIYKVNSYFSPFEKEVIKSDVDEIAKIIDAHGLAFDEVFNADIISMLKEMVIHRDKTGQIFQEVRKIIRLISTEIANELDQYLTKKVQEKAYSNLLYSYCAIGMYLNDEIIGELKVPYANEIRNYSDKNLLVVNHTIILIANKKEISPDNLYTRFKEAIVKDSGNFLTLMGLEMRNLFKECSGFIGKDIDSINELAFFHHKEQSVPSEAFYDFLRELWKNQASSFLYDKNNQPKVFETLEEYKQLKGIDAEMVKFLSDSDRYQQHLGKLNYYYNILYTNRKENDNLKFGDIFKVFSATDQPTDIYLLCITAHCDCLYSVDKISNLFFFVKGSKGNLATSLKKGDTGFDSYIVNNNKVDVINWSDKPFTIYINQTDNNMDKEIPIILGAENKVIKYHSTLKENYAQRIANYAFIYPFHVGIFFSDTKSLK